MTTKVEKTLLVDVPVRTVYNQWTQFEQFPRFMENVEQVTQLADDRLEWVAEIGGVRRQWVAKILEQVPDRKVSWAATEGATNAGEVTFQQRGPSQTEVCLRLEYEPEGFLENVADKLKIVANQAEEDLEHFKDFIETEGSETGGWRGSINEGASAGTPTIEDAAASRGDSGEVTDDRYGAQTSGTGSYSGAAQTGAGSGRLSGEAGYYGEDADSSDLTGGTGTRTGAGSGYGSDDPDLTRGTSQGMGYGSDPKSNLDWGNSRAQGSQSDEYLGDSDELLDDPERQRRTGRDDGDLLR